MAKKVKVVVLKGNHDYIDQNHPFFQFVDWHPNISYFGGPGMIAVDGLRILMLPHIHGKWRTEWADWFDGDEWVQCEYIFIHQSIAGFRTFRGGNVIDVGMSQSVFHYKKTSARVLAGDIHLPQRVGRVEYVGAPYPVLYSDDFSPRIIHIQDGKESSIPVPSIRKAKLRIHRPDELHTCNLERDDQIKVVLRLPKSQYVDWEESRKAILSFCKDKGVHLGGIEVEEVVRTRLGAIEQGPESSNGAVSEEALMERFCNGRDDIDELTKNVGIELLSWRDGEEDGW